MKEISCKNFRCYETLSLQFRPGINLLIGDNSSGKTSVLRMCRHVASTFFAGFSDENTHWAALENEDFRQVSHDGIIAPERPIQIDFSFYPDEIELESYRTALTGADGTSAQHLRKNSRKNSRSLITGFRDYRNYCSELHATFMEESEGRLAQRHALPLLACFTTEDIHTTRKINKEKFLPYAQLPSFGYYECMSSSGFLDYWTSRMLVLQEGGRNLQELDIVRRAIREVLGPEGCGIIADLDIRPNQKRVYYHYYDGREMETSLLSDGYKRLVCIVLDMAFRCALLNRSLYGNDCAHQTRGTVLIDEIDQHLHPSLQAKVLPALRRGFPRVQFIATTHAPMVMTGVESNDDNIVYHLNYDATAGHTIERKATYGLDATEILRDIFGLVPRDNNVDRLLEELFRLIDEDRDTEASQLLTKLQARFGTSLSELAKAEALLNFSLTGADD